MKLNELTPELIEKAKERKTPEERKAFLADNSIELTPEELEKIGGGTAFTVGTRYFNNAITCPAHHKNMYFTGKSWERPLYGVIGFWTEHMNEYYCPDCGEYYEIKEDKYDKKVGDLY